MKTAANVLVGLVAVLHALFMILEMFLWQSEFGLKTFGMTPELAASSHVLAMNQGLYNGILSAGLIWSFFALNPTRISVRTYLLIAIIIAGIFGAATAKMSILFTQALPALLALICVRMSD